MGAASSGFDLTHDFDIKNGVLWEYHGTTPQVCIPEGVLRIRQNAFEGCTTMIGVDIPASVTHIGSRAFAGCTGLLTATIPDTVIGIGDCAFAGCTGLVSVTYSGGCDAVPIGAFERCASLQTVQLPDGIIRIGQRAFNGCINLVGIDFPESVKIISDYAFNHCTALTGIVIPDGVSGIREGTFHGCTALNSVTIPDSVQDIGAAAFAECVTLENIEIPDSVKTIRLGAFHDCCGLKSVKLPPEVVLEYGKQEEQYGCVDDWFNLKGGVFDNCDTLETIDAPKAWKRQNWQHAKCLESEKPGCYVATAVYGSYDCPQVWVLRRYRDSVLAKHRAGRLFIRLYYAVSPALVRWFGKSRPFRDVCRIPLERMVRRLVEAGFSDTPYNDR